MTTDAPQELLALASELARAAGEFARDGRARGLDDVTTKSTITDVVTEYDRASEALIVDRLRIERPGDGLIGEEGTDDPGTSGISWVIDPIDGTTNFLYDLPSYAVSIGVTDADGPLVGAVYLPVTDELFTARRGGGAHRNGRPIRCSTVTDMAVALVATGFGYSPERRSRQARVVGELIPQVRDIRRLGSAAIDLCYAACGRVDAYYEQWLNPWDRAAGELIAAEAGARVSEYPARPGEPNGLLVAPPGLYEALERFFTDVNH